MHGGTSVHVILVFQFNLKLLFEGVVLVDGGGRGDEGLLQDSRPVASG